MNRAITVIVIAAAAALGGVAAASRYSRVQPAATGAYLFRCGGLTCDARNSYCETIKTDVVRLPSNYACRPLPIACTAEPGGQAVDCGCFPAHTRGDFCSAPAVNGVRRFYRTTVGGH
jgi:hypothetical protein